MAGLSDKGRKRGLVITARLVDGTLGVTMGSVLLAMNAGFSAIFWAMGALMLLDCAYGAIAFVKDTIPAR